jgi:threonine dehydrogenase-like Zn-dependent dehydrogenase
LVPAIAVFGRVGFANRSGSGDRTVDPGAQHMASAHGSWVCGILEMKELLEHLARKRLHPEVTVTHSFPLSEAKQAYETFDAGKTGKVMIS